MSIKDLFFGSIFGGGGNASDIDGKQLREMIRYATNLNRYDTTNPFGGTNWEENPDGSWAQHNTLSPEMQRVTDAFIGRMSQGDGREYNSPQQFSQLLDAKMANQQQRHGINQQQRPDPNMFGPSAASQQQQQRQAYDQQMQGFMDQQQQNRDNAPVNETYQSTRSRDPRLPWGGGGYGTVDQGGPMGGKQRF